MKKKDALVLLLQNSLIISDVEKKKILHRLSAFTDEQIDALGVFLAQEQESMLENEEILIKETQLLMDTLELVS